MKLRLIHVGKTHKDFLIKGELEYEKRLKHYTKFERVEIPDIKNAKNKTIDQIKQEEGKLILEACQGAEPIFLLDENGKQRSSEEMAKWIQDQFNKGGKYVTFVIGGAYGFSEEVYQMAQGKISLSKMTFSHEMIRMLFLEQLYRSFTILRNEPYHHS